MGKVHDTYYRYEAAGDQFVGRAVCGLPVDSHMFSVLPPYFENVDEELLSNSCLWTSR
jgi:hypothetical protein